MYQVLAIQIPFSISVVKLLRLCVWMLPYFRRSVSLCLQFSLPALVCQVSEPSEGSGWRGPPGKSITCCASPTCDAFNAFFCPSDADNCTHRSTDLARTAASSQPRQAAPHCQGWGGSQHICPSQAQR